MRQKSRIRDNTRRQNLKNDSLERLQRSNGKQFSSSKNRQSFGKAVKRVIQSLPKDTDKHVTLLAGGRDCITFKDNDDSSTTLQKRILLYRVLETFELFLTEYVDTNINLSLTSFNDLRPMNILVQSYTPERSCLGMYHENMNLLLKPLSKYIHCPGLHSLQ
ncbi:unnamed protein product [Rotaria sp. Silwood2]|nr:unnamed protein product [Rotaria sp. Silwood2]